MGECAEYKARTAEFPNLAFALIHIQIHSNRDGSTLLLHRFPPNSVNIPTLFIATIFPDVGNLCVSFPPINLPLKNNISSTPLKVLSKPHQLFSSGRALVGKINQLLPPHGHKGNSYCHLNTLW